MKKLLILAALFLVFAHSWGQEDVILPQKPNRPGYTEYRLLNTGFWCAVEAEGGSTVMINHKNMQAVGLTYTAGYRFGEYLRIGVGAGARYYVNGNEVRKPGKSEWTFPLFVNARGNIIPQYDRTVVPYWSLNLGGMAGDGFFISPTIGMRIGEPRNSFLIGVGYSFNKIEAAPLSNDYTSGVVLRIGYEF